MKDDIKFLINCPACCKRMKSDDEKTIVWCRVKDCHLYEMAFHMPRAVSTDDIFPTDETLNAIKEAESGDLTRYTSIDEFLDDLEGD